MTVNDMPHAWLDVEHDSVALQYRDAIAAELDNAADWRWNRAHKFPDDARNARASGALRVAAEYVRELDRDAEPLQPFLDFHGHLSSWAHGSDDPASILPTPSGWELCKRFFFDNGTREPTRRDFDRLLDGIHREMLEVWREGLTDDGASIPPASLVEYFVEQGVPLYDSEDED